MKELIKDISVAAVIVLIATQFYEPTRVFGVSMQPSFQENDYLVVSRLAYRAENPKRGDVIIFQSTLKDKHGNDELLIKRVIGLPGEHLVIRDGRVLIDDEVLQEPYLDDDYTDGEIDEEVPEGSFFCMGDNRSRSTDSRDSSVGFVKKEQINGKVVFRLFPFNSIGRIKAAAVH